MLLRLFFVLLIALNIAVAAWLLLGDSGTRTMDPNDGGVPRLKLLAEVPAPAVTGAAPSVSASMAIADSAARASTVATPAIAPAKPATTAPVVSKPADKPVADAPISPRRSYRCLAIGPFPTQVDLRAARTAISPRTVRSRQRQEQTSESRGWRVFLPAQSTRDQALAQARRLEGKGIKDYFVVTAQGEMQNSVALGLFHDPANARKRRDEVIAAGFPARMSERTETTPVWWLDVVVPDEAGSDIRKGIRTPGVTARTTGCF